MSMNLEIKGQELQDLDMVSFEGWEEISEPYVYIVRFLTTTDTTTKTLTGKQVTFDYEVAGLLEQNEPAYVHGYIHGHRILGLSLDRKFVTELEIRPRLYKLSLSGQTQVFGTTSKIKLPDLAKSILSPSSYKEGTSTQGDFSDDREIDCDMPGDVDQTERSFIVQYRETDLHFLSRIIENEGIFYFVSNDKSKETVQFGDKNHIFKKIGGKVPYIPQHLVNAAPVEEHVRTVHMRAEIAPKKMYVRDYNPNEASRRGQYLRNHAVDSNGSGAMVSYYEHYTSTSDGDRYAKIRAEEKIAWQRVFECETNSTRLRPGYLFTMDTDETKLNGLNQRYLVAGCHVRYSKGLDSVWVEDGHPFKNEIVCIALPSDATWTFRPKRRAEKPKVAGLIRALVDNDAGGQEAKLDDNGTYKIRLVEEESTESRLPSGKASANVRHALPYGGGQDTGFQFPLYKGTEVILACIEGDPDLPVIVGTVANSDNKTVLDGIDKALNKNKTNRIRTRSGITIELIDG
ncbi:type VI secretion system VgrG family protein [Amorphus orientalis]|uniref:Type VI secretion system VgrG family protein n=2 Tax=Amorphus orientalis TaxID=649198 RepID=A0AAE3VLP6_9HYPH|nr:type VI secretion system VgrG family protein [Amorphus orientalis]